MNFLSLLLNNKRLITNGLKKSSFALGPWRKFLKELQTGPWGTIHLILRLCRKPPRVSGNRTREGLGDHGDVRVAVGDGRSRPVHVRRQRCSSAARNPAYSRRNRSIERVREFHGMLGKTWVQGI
jgi:hypothetical protein